MVHDGFYTKLLNVLMKFIYCFHWQQYWIMGAKQKWIENAYVILKDTKKKKKKRKKNL